MITAEQSTQMILAKYPDFEETRKKWMKNFGEPSGFSGEMFIFTDYVLDLLRQKENEEKIKEIFVFIEKLMCEGTEEVQEAAATCFLENLVNVAGWKTISAASFAPYLGKESKEYCKAWDEFCKVKTPGLWDEEKNTTTK